MRRIIIKDKIYGKSEITSPVIIDLLNSKSIHRLKKISQFGIPDEFYHLKNFTRHEHSVGVMFLLKLLKASEEEQIAGLLHDVSHTAFSHVIDWVVGSGETEDFQDINHKRYLESSNIKDILEKYGYSLERVTNYKIFTLLEKSSPDLCADRVDYALREFSLKTARLLVSRLTNFNGEILFKNKESASVFAHSYLDKQIKHWGGFEAVSRYRIFGNVLRLALDKKAINFDDFWSSDEHVLKKIKLANIPEINKLLSILKKKSLNGLFISSLVVYKKFRYVDPKFISGDGFIRLSEIDEKFKLMLKEAEEWNKKGIRVPVLI
ncbi:MAG: HD domain-containing protein [Patescibacteria group bacterium]